MVNREVIYDMINQDEKPGYGYQLKKGATSLTEAWDANHQASHNHFMLGHITEWFYKDLVGIDSGSRAAGLCERDHQADTRRRSHLGRGELRFPAGQDHLPMGS